MANYGHLGPYELRGELGRGAMARVWRAWDPNLQREVAIKEPLYDSKLSEALLDELGRRFVAEGRTAARLSHPGIVTIFAADVWDGRPAIVMELIEGETLARRLSHGALNPQEALAVLDQLLDAVGYAHARSVVHRDIKPDNIFITNDGRVKLTDFGIARMDGSVSTIGTVAGTVLGTPGYMSPEQATGAVVDARSDIFSVGTVAYEMLTGSNPFGAGYGTDATTLIYRIVHEPAPELPPSVAAGLPVDLRPAVMCALAKDPAYRPQSAKDFKAMLHGQLEPPLASIAGGVGSDPNRSGSFRSVPGNDPADYHTVVSVSSTGNWPTGPQPSPGSYGSQGYYADGSTGGGYQRRSNSWLPYALVAVVALGILAFVLFNALGSGGGGRSSSGNVSSTGTAAQQESNEPSSTSQDAPVAAGEAYYLAVSDGKVAIFSNSSATPVEVSDVEVSKLGSSSAAELDAHVPAPTVDEARELVEGYRKEVETAEAKAQEEAKKAEEEAARKAEEEAKAKAEAEERARQEQEAAAAAAGSTATLTVVGADGTTRTETIHRQGTSERVFPDSNSRYLSESEVAALSDAERCIAWNEIIAASNGYAFMNSGLADYFAGCSWYYRNPGASAGGNLTDAGSANVDLLKAYTSSWWMNLATY